jgi:hypothetical protein
MYRIENWCKIGATPGKKESAECFIEGELLPCPICGRIPVPMVRKDCLDGYVAVISCFGGGGTSHAYVKTGSGKSWKVALDTAVNDWSSGNIDYFERLPNVFRSCYSCVHSERQPGTSACPCEIGMTRKNDKPVRPQSACQKYERMDVEAWRKSLTR